MSNRPPADADVDVKKYPQMSRDDVGSMIASGKKIVIVDGYALKVDAWLKYHPGGDIAILHLVGRDATDEVDACVHTALFSPFGQDANDTL